MKKMMSILLATALSAALAVPAFAAAPTTTKANGADKWTTAGSNAAYAGDMMTIVAYESDALGIDLDSIQYIDQTTADENGAYSFTDYIPKNLPTTVDYKVLVGGESIPTPLDAGLIEAPKTTTVVVSGTVTMGNNLAEATVKAYTADQTATLIDSATTVGGAYTLDLEPGVAYNLEFTRDGYLKHTLKNVTVAAAGSIGAVKPVAGDLDGNSVINTSDLSSIIGAFKATPEDQTKYSALVDIDGNAVVNTSDLSSVIGVFKAVPTEKEYNAQ